MPFGLFSRGNDNDEVSRCETFEHAQSVTILWKQNGIKYTLKRVGCFMKMHQFICNERDIKIVFNETRGRWMLELAEEEEDDYGFGADDSSFTEIAKLEPQTMKFMNGKNVFADVVDVRPRPEKSKQIRGKVGDEGRRFHRDWTDVSSEEHYEPRRTSRSSERPRLLIAEPVQFARFSTVDHQSLRRRSGRADNRTNGVSFSATIEKARHRQATATVMRIVEEKMGTKISEDGAKTIQDFVDSCLAAYRDGMIPVHHMQGAMKRLSYDWTNKWNDGTKSQHFLQIVAGPACKMEDVLTITYCHTCITGTYNGDIKKLKEQMVWECVKEQMPPQNNSLMLESRGRYNENTREKNRRQSSPLPYAKARDGPAETEMDIDGELPIGGRSRQHTSHSPLSDGQRMSGGGSSQHKFDQRMNGGHSKQHTSHSPRSDGQRMTRGGSSQHTFDQRKNGGGSSHHTSHSPRSDGQPMIEGGSSHHTSHKPRSDGQRMIGDGSSQHTFDQPMIGGGSRKHTSHSSRSDGQLMIGGGSSHHTSHIPRSDRQRMIKGGSSQHTSHSPRSGGQLMIGGGSSHHTSHKPRSTGAGTRTAFSDPAIGSEHRVAGGVKW